MKAVSRRHFERLVRRAVRELPPPFRDRLENVAIIVETWPSPRQLQRSGVRPGYTLLGLYEGVPHTRRGEGYQFALPDRIFIFQGPLQQRAAGDDELVEAVRRTVVHEIAHHFGIDDARLAELERERG